ncbi:MAG TPA: glycosyltransferase, partial [Ktedonobacterales bacterium]|nr:glycosyltransferase [Ktedonobacterales bacterium]
MNTPDERRSSGDNGGASSAALPFISVIIPVWNRCEDLKDTLLQLQRQTYDNYEVIVVDNDSPEP